MCGIIGFSGNTEFDISKIKLLMIWNSLERGKDSTGVYSVKNGLKKNTDEAYKFLNNCELEPDKTLLAHVRAATVGNKIDKNAHPFKRGDTILIHNGTLKNHWELCRKYDLDYNDHWVDSDIICSIINKDKSFKVFGEITGAGAFIVVNEKDPNTMFIFRNSERPLYKGNIDGNMYISSISESLEFIGCKNVKEFKEDCLYEINNGVIISTKVIKKNPYNVTTYHNNNYSRDWSKYINKWFKCTHVMNYSNGKNVNFTKDKYYLLKSKSKDSIYMCDFIDDNEEEVNVSIYNFLDNPYVIEEKSHCIVMTNLTISKSKERLADIGDICFVKKIYDDDKVDVTFPFGKEGVWTINSKKYIRPCEPSEINDLLDKSSNDSCNLPVKVDVNDIDETFNQEQLNNNKEEEDFEEETPILTVIDINDLNDFISQFNDIISRMKINYNIVEINGNINDLEDIVNEFVESTYENI